MKAKTNRRLQNAIQNFLIVFLICSALFLLTRTNLLRSDLFSDMLFGVSQGTIYLSGGSDNHGLPVELPVHIAVRSGGECRSWQNETTSGAVFEDLGSFLTEAIGSASGSTEISSEEFRRALENDSLYYDFTTTLPLPLLAQWLGETDSAPQVSARALLLSGLPDSTGTLYAWDSTQNRFYRWNTSVPSDTLLSTVGKHSGRISEFAFLSDAPFRDLAPHTLLCSDRISLFSLNAGNALISAEEDPILSQLEFHLYTQYTESSGTTVITQGSRTLRFFPNGTVSYHGEEEDIPLLQVSSEEEEPVTAEYMDAAQKVAETLLLSRIGDATLYPLSILCDSQGNAEVSFGYMINGYPIAFRDSPAVKITMKDHTITNITLHLRNYSLTATSSALMPVLQASAAAQSDPARELFPGYLDDGNELLSPCWLQK